MTTKLTSTIALFLMLMWLSFTSKADNIILDSIISDVVSKSIKRQLTEKPIPSVLSYDIKAHGEFPEISSIAQKEFPFIECADLDHSSCQPFKPCSLDVYGLAIEASAAYKIYTQNPSFSLKNYLSDQRQVLELYFDWPDVDKMVHKIYELEQSQPDRLLTHYSASVLSGAKMYSNYAASFTPIFQKEKAKGLKQACDAVIHEMSKHPNNGYNSGYTIYLTDGGNGRGILIDHISMQIINQEIDIEVKNKNIEQVMELWGELVRYSVAATNAPTETIKQYLDFIDQFKLDKASYINKLIPSIKSIDPKGINDSITEAKKIAISMLTQALSEQLHIKLSQRNTDRLNCYNNNICKVESSIKATEFYRDGIFGFHSEQGSH